MADHWLSFRAHALLQVLAAGLFIFAMMYGLYLYLDQPIIWVVGISSLASSAFLVFCAPQSRSASPKRIVLGYALSMCVGLLTHMALEIFCNHCDLDGTAIQPILISGALAVSLSVTLLLMVYWGAPHPPAAGVVLVIVIQHHMVMNIFVLLIAALTLALVRWAFGPYLVELVRRPQGKA